MRNQAGVFQQSGVVFMPGQAEVEVLLIPDHRCQHWVIPKGYTKAMTSRSQQ